MQRLIQVEQLMAWPPCFPVLEHALGATALFDGQTRGDLILRSSDSIDFFVIEAFLRHISPDFDAMFPLLNRETYDGRAVISVEECSKVLHPLLSITTYKNVVVSTRKYKMAMIEQRLHKQAAVSLIMKQPLYVFIAATAVGWGDVVKMAALNMLLQPLNVRKPRVRETPRWHLHRRHPRRDGSPSAAATYYALCVVKEVIYPQPADDPKEEAPGVLTFLETAV
ncbi:hypothetical protein JOM56_012871 [Amanita muscaria]